MRTLSVAEIDPSARELNVVLIREAQRREIAKYVDRRRSGDRPPSPTFEVIAARRLEIDQPVGSELLRVLGTVREHLAEHRFQP